MKIRIFAALALLLCFVQLGRAQTVVQTACGGSSTNACQFSTSNVTAGNAIAVSVLDYLDSGTPSVFSTSDNNSNSYSCGPVQSDAGSIFGNAGLAICWACNIVATPNAKPTVTVTDTQGTPHIVIFEISGVASSCHDQTASNSATTGNTTTP